MQRSVEGAENAPTLEGAEGGGVSEAACTVTPNYLVVKAIRAYFAIRYPRASKHLVHYLEGQGAPFQEDLRALFAENPRAAQRVAGLIDGRGSDTGALVGRTTSSAVVRQQDYDAEDWKLSLGGIDQIDYRVVERAEGGPSQVELTILDPYQWHPAEDRGDQCIHEAMESRKEVGAREYDSVGTAVVPLPLRTRGS